MKCYVHCDKDAVTRCSKCGKDICRECKVDYFGNDICVECGKPLLNAFGPMLHNNPDVLEPKKKISDYLGPENKMTT